MKTDLLDLRYCDCMELMSEFPDKYFDLAIVDPPYFDRCSKHTFTGSEVSTTGVKRNRYESKRWKIPGAEYFDELFRVSQRQIIWGCNYFAKYIPHVGRIIWDKVNDSSSFSKAEIASRSERVGVDMYRYRWNGMLQADMVDKEKRIHPTQKPVALYRWLLENYASPGQRILDTHMGSGSIAIACHYAECYLTASELDEDYFETACERVRLETRQMELFPIAKT